MSLRIRDGGGRVQRAKPSMKLPPFTKRGFLSALIVLFLTGLTWKGLDFFEFDGDGSQRAKRYLLVLHGVAAQVYILLFGSILFGHVRDLWEAKRNRRTGALLVALNIFLVITGLLLYYAGNEALRAFAAETHFVAGVVLFLPLVLHLAGRTRIRQVSRHVAGHSQVSTTSTGLASDGEQLRRSSRA